MSQKIRIISFIGSKGGVGTSVIANNTAIGLAIQTRAPILLMDMDTIRGGVQSSLLDLEPSQTLKDLILSGISIKTIQSVVQKHRTNVHVLPAPPPMEGISLKNVQVAELFSQSALEYQNIVIDLANPIISEELIACLDFSTLIFLVITPDITSIQQSRTFFKQMHGMHFGVDKFYPLLNMAGLSDDIMVEDIAEILGRQVEYKIPNDSAVITSINRGIPLMQNNASPSFTQYLSKMIKNIIRFPPTDLAKVIKSDFKTQPYHVVEQLQTLMPVPLKKGTGIITALSVISSPISGITVDQYKQIKQSIHKRLVNELKLTESDLKYLDDAEKKEEVKNIVRDKIARIIEEERLTIPSRNERVQVIEELTNEALGFGPLEDFLTDPTVTEILVNGPDKIYIEQNGKLHLSGRAFMDEKQLRVTIDRIVAPIGKRIDESSPMVDARLPDGSRVNVIIPPLSLIGPTISIRKFPQDRMTMKEYLKFNTLTSEMADFIEGCVKAKLNIVISGGTGSGKTTLLNILSAYIGNDERIVTIEDAAELKLQQEHVVRLEARPPNIEGKGAIAIRDLVRNSLRMRPDRIIVGEVRGGEALDMLQAMNTGHEGSLTTVHANSPRDALARIETMVLMAGLDLPIRAIREQIASAINICIHQSRLRDGGRKIIKVVEITGMEGDIITMQDIFAFEQKTVDDYGRVVGEFRHAEIRPKSLDNFVNYGIRLPRVFDPKYMLGDGNIK